MKTTTAPDLLHTPEDIARARQRAADPAWQAAADHLRHAAQRAAERWPALPAFDPDWYDANPQRDFAETYDLFAAYVYPARDLAGDINTLLTAAAVLEEPAFHEQAMRCARHIVEHLQFHVQHHDAGLCYGLVAMGLARAYMAGEPHDALFREQLEACAEAIRTSTRHWLTNLAHMAYNNHYAHQRRGLLAIGVALNRTDWIDEALTGPRNFGELLVGCTMDDGLCYESSTTYHFATLGALDQLARVVRASDAIDRDLYHETFANGRTFKQMFDAPIGLMLPNRELPSHGDCYARRQPLGEAQAGLYEHAFNIWGDPRHAWLLSHKPRDTWPALVYGADALEPATPPAPVSRLWPEHGYALLTSHDGPAYWREPAVAAVMTGDHSGIHHHLDTLSIHVAAGGRIWVEDPEVKAVEQQAFAAPIQKAFNRTSLAHNTVMVDERNQQTHRQPLRVVAFKDLPACRTVAMADTEGWLYPGVWQQRTLAVTADYVLDLFELDSDNAHVFDWVVHPRTDASVTATPSPSERLTLPDRAPYQVLRHVAAAPVADGGSIRLNWAQDADRFRADVTAGGPATLIRAERPVQSDNQEGTRALFMLRTQAEAANFLALYQPDADQPWHVAAHERVFNGEFREHRITIARGSEQVHHTFRAL